MNKWFATISCGNGMILWELIESKTQDEAEVEARLICIDFASSYGYYQNIEHFGDYDQLCKEDSWCNEEKDYREVSKLDYYVVPYDPKEHDGYL